MKKETRSKEVHINKAKSPKKAVDSKSRAQKIGIAAGKAFITVMLIFIITGSLVVGAITIYVIKYVKPDQLDLSNAKLKFTSIVYATDPDTGKDNEVANLSGEQNRIWVDLKNVPDNLKNAFISTEDQRFYEHEGVDWKRSVGAFANLFLHFYSSNQGGSTITQQVVKNLNGDYNDRSIGIKIKEIVTALNIEKKYTKDQILESYVNCIPLGESCYGVQTASNTYFGKDVSQLDLAQCALLAGLTQAPNSYDPLKHADKAKQRQKYVLQNMVKQKMITQAQYNDAVNEKLTYVGKKTSTIRSWFVDQVITDVINDLVSKKGYTKENAQNLIYTKGLSIYSTMNPKVQSAMDSVYQDDSYWSKVKSGDSAFQSAMAIVDYSGKVVGIEGGRGQKTQNMVWNRATSSKRQPGSTIKPIGVYGPAIENNLINWSTIFQDSPISLNGQQWPKDDDGWFNTDMTVCEALQRSKNTVAVKIEQMLSPQKTYDFLTSKLGFTTLVKTRTQNGKTYSDLNLGIAIGALTDGVTVEEMAGGYEIYGNNGVYTKPYTYTKVLDNNGNVLLQNKPASTQALSADTATIVNKLMQQVIYGPHGTATYVKISNCVIAGKTGTTSDNKDRWFAGLTPNYVGIVWTGYDSPKDIGEGTNPAALAWKYVMTKVQQGIAQKDFPASGNVVQESYNSSTGQISAGGDAVGWYKSSDVTSASTTAANGKETEPASAWQ